LAPATNQGPRRRRAVVHGVVCLVACSSLPDQLVGFRNRYMNAVEVISYVPYPVNGRLRRMFMMVENPLTTSSNHYRLDGVPDKLCVHHGRSIWGTVSSPYLTKVKGLSMAVGLRIPIVPSLSSHSSYALSSTRRPSHLFSQNPSVGKSHFTSMVIDIGRSTST
jgi:hypothetical protein